MAFSLFALPAFAGDTAIARFEVGAKQLEMSAADFAGAAPLFGEQGAGLAFELSPDAASAFADLTAGSIGEALSFAVCGDVLVSAVIRERISGRGQVGLESLGAATHYAGVLNGEISC